MEQIDPLVAIENWYSSICDGDWEHTYGIKIETLDNPGWAVDVDLLGTPLEGTPFEQIVIDRTENDWVRCWVEKNVYKGRGGARNLSEILRCFSEWQMT
jgi:hypothetical protein